MRFFEKKSYKEISEEMNCVHGTVSGTLARALTKMRDKMVQKNLFKAKDSLPSENTPKIEPMAKERQKRVLSYDEAKAKLESFKLNTRKDFYDLKDKGALPEGIPSSPYQTYKVQHATWISWDDFLSVKKIEDFIQKEEKEEETIRMPDEIHKLGRNTNNSNLQIEFVNTHFDSLQTEVDKEILELKTRIAIDTAKLKGLLNLRNELK
jgi:hypothetical protein